MDTMSPLEKTQYLSQNCWDLRDSLREVSIILGETGLKLAKEHNFLHEYSTISNFLGIGKLYYDFNIKEALTYFSQGLEAALKARDSIEIGFTYNNTGDVYFITGNISLASAYADTSLSYFEACNYPRGLAYTYINLGQVARARNRYEEAISYFKKAIEIHTELGIIPGVSAANLESARTMVAQKKYSEALDFYSHSLALTKLANNKVYLANSLCGIGDVYYYLDNLPAALDHYDQALDLNLMRNQKAGMINCYMGKALVFSKLKQKENGERAFHLAEVEAQKLGLPSISMNVKKAKIEFYNNLGDLSRAVSETQNTLVFYDSLFLNQQFETLEEIRDKTRITINLDEKSHQLSMQRKAGILMGSALVLILILTFLLIRNNRRQIILNAQLQSINKGKDKLFSIIAHDLRNPFNAIMQYLELVKEDDLSPTTRKKYLKQLEDSTQNTFNLLENLLKLSAFRTGRIIFSPQFFDFSKLILQVEDTLVAQLQEKKIELIQEISNDKIYADQNMMEVIVRNLISNAIKYSSSGSLIKINYTLSKSMYQIEVIDQGIGMSKELINTVFNSDNIESKLGTSGEKGTGIGLNLCYEFVREHKGRISIESKENRGSAFKILLPRN